MTMHSRPYWSGYFWVIFVQFSRTVQRSAVGLNSFKRFEKIRWLNGKSLIWKWKINKAAWKVIADRLFCYMPRHAKPMMNNLDAIRRHHLHQSILSLVHRESVQAVDRKMVLTYGYSLLFSGYCWYPHVNFLQDIGIHIGIHWLVSSG